MGTLAYSKGLAKRYSTLGSKYTSSDKRLISSLPVVKHKIVLDLGCGDGKYSIFLAQRGARAVFGIDPSIEMIHLAKEKSTKQVHFQKGSVEKIPFSARKFDLIFCRFVLHYFPNNKVAFREVHRVLKKGGKFVAIFNCFETGKAELYEKIIPMELGIGAQATHIKIYCKSPMRVKNDLEDAGLKIMRFKNVSNTDAKVSHKFADRKKVKILTIVLVAQKSP